MTEASTSLESDLGDTSEASEVDTSALGMASMMDISNPIFGLGARAAGALVSDQATRGGRNLKKWGSKRMVGARTAASGAYAEAAAGVNRVGKGFQAVGTGISSGAAAGVNKVGQGFQAVGTGIGNGINSGFSALERKQLALIQQDRMRSEQAYQKNRGNLLARQKQAMEKLKASHTAAENKLYAQHQKAMSALDAKQKQLCAKQPKNHPEYSRLCQGSTGVNRAGAAAWGSLRNGKVSQFNLNRQASKAGTPWKANQAMEKLKAPASHTAAGNKLYAQLNLNRQASNAGTPWKANGQWSVFDE